ncbi:hypothetical protein TcCL_ESM04156, partial [Trypanosoma cruzi]
GSLSGSDARCNCAKSRELSSSPCDDTRELNLFFLPEVHFPLKCNDNSSVSSRADDCCLSHAFFSSVSDLSAATVSELEKFDVKWFCADRICGAVTHPPPPTFLFP